MLVGDLFKSHTRIAVARNTNHVIAELRGDRPSVLQHRSRLTRRQVTSDATYPYSRPSDLWPGSSWLAATVAAVRSRVIPLFLATVVLSGCGAAGLGDDSATLSAADIAESGTRQDFVDSVAPLLGGEVIDINSTLQAVMPDLPAVDYGSEPVEVFDFRASIEEQEEGYEARRQAVFQTAEQASSVIARLEQNTVAGFAYVETTESSGEGLIGEAIITDTSVRFVADEDDDDRLIFVVKTESDSSITQISVVRLSLLDEPVELAEFAGIYSGWASDYPIDDEVQIVSMSVARRFQGLTLFVPPISFSMELRSETQSGPELVAEFEENAIAQGWTKTAVDDRDNFFTHPDGYSVTVSNGGPTFSIETEVDLATG